MVFIFVHYVLDMVPYTWDDDLYSFYGIKTVTHFCCYRCPVSLSETILFYLTGTQARQASFPDIASKRRMRYLLQ